MTEAERRGGLPLVAGGFSFGSAVALRAIAGDGRVAAFVASASLSRPIPARISPGRESRRSSSTGERDAFGPPALLRSASGLRRIVEVPGVDHFFEGKLRELEDAIARFLAALPASVAVRDVRISLGDGAPRSPVAGAPLARGSVSRRVRRRASPPTAPSRSGSRALFVTLRRRGELRGCIGTLSPEGDLTRMVRGVRSPGRLRRPAVSAALRRRSCRNATSRSPS